MAFTALSKTPKDMLVKARYLDKAMAYRNHKELG